MTTQNDGNGRATKGDLQALQYDLTRAMQSVKDQIISEITTVKVDFAETKTLVRRNCTDLEKTDQEIEGIKKDITDLKSGERKMTVVATFVSSIIATVVAFFKG